jgi:HSP20 family protein
MSKGARSRTDITRRESHAPTPFTFMRRFSEEMDRLFEDFGLGRGLIAPTFESRLDKLSALGNAMWAPQVEVFERDNQVVIRADLPGMTKDDFSVDITKEALVIRGERRSEIEDDKGGYYHSERSYGNFYRRIPLPEGIDVDDAKADFRNGVLEITMKSTQRTEQKPRQLEIRGEIQIGEEPRTKAKGAGER